MDSKSGDHGVNKTRKENVFKEEWPLISNKVKNEINKMKEINKMSIGK